MIAADSMRAVRDRGRPPDSLLALQHMNTLSEGSLRSLAAPPDHRASDRWCSGDSARTTAVSMAPMTARIGILAPSNPVLPMSSVCAR